MMAQAPCKMVTVEKVRQQKGSISPPTNEYFQQRSQNNTSTALNKILRHISKQQYAKRNQFDSEKSVDFIRNKHFFYSLIHTLVKTCLNPALSQMSTSWKISGLSVNSITRSRLLGMVLRPRRIRF